MLISKRLEWIDWMKTIGIYLIVLGHFGSIGEKFLYSFHVPLFFIISGILCKKECDTHIFLKKLWYNLVVPMVIMTGIYLVYICVSEVWDGKFELRTVYWLVRKVLFGIVSGFGNLWFVYTLILLKIFYQLISSKAFFYSLVVGMLILAYSYNTSDHMNYPFFVKAPNVFVNICAAYPFFSFGIFLQEYKRVLNDLDGKLLALVFVFALFLVRASIFHNGFVAMYYCNYGGSMFWYIVGGVAGSIMTFAVAKFLGKAPKVVTIISRGTIIILGFQSYFIDILKSFAHFPLFFSSCIDILYAAVIVVAFVPIIMFVEKYCPLMIGIFRLNHNHIN